MAENLGIKNPPEVEIVRFVDWDESAQVREECLAEAGFVSAGGGMYDVDEAQWDAYVLANYVCTFQYPYPREYSRPWGVEQKRAQYRWTVNFLIPCLEKEGYEVSQEAPTEQTFIDTWETDNTYYPYNYITIPHDANYNVEQERLNRVCLQVGVGSVIFGDETIEEWKARTGR